MIAFSLYDDPNFTMQVSPEGYSYNFHFKFFQGLTYVTITNNIGEIVSGPIRVANGQWLIPCMARNYSGAGNFTIVNTTGDYPQYENFKENCELRYYTLGDING